MPEETSARPTRPKSSQDAFMKELQKTLLSQSDLISSTDSNIERSIGDAIEGVETMRDKNTQRLESYYTRERGYQVDRNRLSEQNALEERTGYATPVVGFQSLRDYNAKSIRDLDQRKQELILQGESEAAGKIADLMVKQLEFEADAAQRTFNNLISMGNLSLAIKGAERSDYELELGQFNADRSYGLAEREQAFTERSAIGAVALQYGLKVEPGETIDSIITKAQPYASEEQKLKLEKARVEISALKAGISRDLAAAAASNRENQPMSAEDIDLLAKGYIKNPEAVAGLIKNSQTMSKVLMKAGELNFENAKGEISNNQANGIGKDDTIANINSDPSLSATEKGELINYTNSLYPSRGASGGGFPQFARDAVRKGSEAQIGLGEWILGL